MKKPNIWEEDVKPLLWLFIPFIIVVVVGIIVMELVKQYL